MLIVSQQWASGFRLTLSRIWKSCSLLLTFFVSFVPAFVFFVIRSSPLITHTENST